MFRAEAGYQVWLSRNKARLIALCRPYFVLDPDAPQAPETERKGAPGAPSFGSTSSLKALLRKYRDKKLSIADLAYDKDAMRRGGRPMAADMAAFCKASIRSALLVREPMNLTTFRALLGAEMRAVPSMRGRSVPSHAALENMIAGLENAQVVAARFGIRRMKQTTVMRTKGFEYTRPGELLLMDCWKIDQVTLVKEAGGWILVN